MSIECVSYGSKFFCYDEKTKEVYEFLRQDSSLDKCPQTVLQRFLEKKFDVEIIINKLM